MHLMPVILFNSDRPNIINKEIIEQQQQLYMYLLQKELKSEFCSPLLKECCNSCKAFFRRNAFKYEIYKCRFSGDCIIGKTNRRLCKKCRLKKCFDVGMKKEWILNEEERESRRHTIETNRKLRKNGLKDTNNNNNDLNTNTSSDVSNIGTIDTSVDNSIDNLFDKTNNNTMNDITIDDEITECITQMANIDPNEIIDGIDLYEMSMKSTNNNVIIITDLDQIKNLCISDDTNSNSMAIDIYSANNTMKRLIDLNCFNNYERNRLDELFSLSLFDKSY
ncbi:unnamed protein product, partial [Medioppia subpectinata]